MHLPRFQHLLGPAHHQAPHDVREFAHVAQLGVGADGRQRGGSQSRDLPAKFLVVFREKVRH